MPRTRMRIEIPLNQELPEGTNFGFVRKGGSFSIERRQEVCSGKGREAELSFAAGAGRSAASSRRRWRATDSQLKSRAIFSAALRPISRRMEESFRSSKTRSKSFESFSKYVRPLPAMRCSSRFPQILQCAYSKSQNGVRRPRNLASQDSQRHGRAPPMLSR